ncbi:photosystem reaction center subunit H [Beijerinckiaceae bacterium]|nr:photosystem reaction center subunit H [Beijerinckiaceae bacterium]
MGTANPEFNLISSEDVEGTAVFDPSGNEIGNVDHLMIDKLSGQVRYAIMSFGGFLGLGHSHYPLPWSSLTYDKQRDGYMTNVTEQQLKDAPEFSDDSWTNRAWESQVHRHYNAQPYWDESGTRLSEGSSTTPRSL